LFFPAVQVQVSRFAPEHSSATSGVAHAPLPLQQVAVQPVVSPPPEQDPPLSGSIPLVHWAPVVGAAVTAACHLSPAAVVAALLHCVAHVLAGELPGQPASADVDKQSKQVVTSAVSAAVSAARPVWQELTQASSALVGSAKTQSVVAEQVTTAWQYDAQGPLAVEPPVPPLHAANGRAVKAKRTSAEALEKMDMVTSKEREEGTSGARKSAPDTPERR
jgi:hypothetical protein